MTTDIEQATVERLAEMCRCLAGWHEIRDGQTIQPTLELICKEARAISALLPPPVDPDLVTARELASAVLFDCGGSGPMQRGQSIRSGLGDETPAMRATLAALRKAREEGVK